MSVLVIGQGSIGRRHAENFRKISKQVGVVSSHLSGQNVFSSLAEGLEALKPRSVIVCSETGKHYQGYLDLVEANFDGNVVFEKPLFSETVEKLPLNRFNQLVVAYNLRFHPLIVDLKNAISDKRVLSVHAYVGQFLPNWRPGKSYKDSYSANRQRGGGVLRDLSHELDYLFWIFGWPQKLISDVQRLSSLEIDVEDSVNILSMTERGVQVNLHMNYLDHNGRRSLIVQYEGGTIEVDLVRGVFKSQVEKKVEVDRNFTYQVLAEKIDKEEFADFCDFASGLKVLEIIEACERSSKGKVWVNL